MPEGGRLTIETGSLEPCRRRRRPRAGALRDARGERHRQRHGREYQGPPLRALLHHQARRARNRARPLHRVRRGEAVRRAYFRRERAGQGLDFPYLPALAGGGGARPARRRPPMPPADARGTRPCWWWKTRPRCEDWFAGRSAASATGCSRPRTAPKRCACRKPRRHHPPAARRRGHARDERQGGGPKWRRCARHEGALYVRLCRRRNRAPWRARTGVAYIAKPFTPEALAAKVREVLGAPQTPAACWW